MKIYTLPIHRTWEPRISPFVAHSRGFNIETGFLDFLNKSSLLTDNPQEADWHYIPIFWSHWQLANDYGRQNRDEMQELLDNIILDDKRTFTVSEADNEPGFEIGETKVFSGNQTVGWNRHIWVAAPIITLPHRVPAVLPEKKYLTNFVGNTRIWKTRVDMVNALKGRSDVKIVESVKGEDLFVNTILESYSALCPRGSALGSYRFYESMQLGVVPIMISNEDFRPFKNKIAWDTCSYYVDSIEKLTDLLNNVTKEELKHKGMVAAAVWKMLYKDWPKWILELL